jgi:hypothetical protein
MAAPGYAACIASGKTPQFRDFDPAVEGDPEDYCVAGRAISVILSSDWEGQGDWVLAKHAGGLPL